MEHAGNSIAIKIGNDREEKELPEERASLPGGASASVVESALSSLKTTDATKTTEIENQKKNGAEEQHDRLKERESQSEEAMLRNNNELTDPTQEGKPEEPSTKIIPSNTDQSKKAISNNNSGMQITASTGNNSGTSKGKNDIKNSERFALVLVARELWKFEGVNINPHLWKIYKSLPDSVYNAVTKTTVFQFQKTPSIIPPTKSMRIAQDMLKNLKEKGNLKMVSKPTKLAGLKCSYCAQESNHVPGSISFLWMSYLESRDVAHHEKLAKIVLNAIRQRLEHLKKCPNALRELGTDEVKNLFGSPNKQDDVTLLNFTKAWLAEWKRVFLSGDNKQPNLMPQKGKRNQLSQERMQQNQVPPQQQNVLTNGAPSNVSIPSSQPLHRVVHQQQHHDTSSIIYPHQLFLQQQLQKQQRQQQQQQQYLQRLSLQTQAHQHMLRRQHQYPYQNIHSHQEQRLQQLRSMSNGQHNPQLQMLLQHQQQHQQQHHHNQQHQQQQQQQQIYYQQQQQQQQEMIQQERKRKRQREPSIFPKRKHIPFVQLEQTYETGWEDTTWSLFNTYNSDEDLNDETEKYFGSLQKGQENSENFPVHSQPPMPPPRANLDYCRILQPHQLAQCPNGVPFRTEIDPLSQLHDSLTEIPLPAAIGKEDVVIVGENCPPNFARTCHNCSGNRLFLRLVSDHRCAYKEASKDEKAVLVRAILRQIANMGGTFLEAHIKANKKACKTVKVTAKHAKAYTVFRLERGFPDVLDHGKLGSFFVWKRGLEATGVWSASKNNVINGEVNSMASTTKETILNEVRLRSRVYKVEHAPKVGLMNGFIEWNTSTAPNPNEPKIPFSELRTKVSPPAEITVESNGLVTESCTDESNGSKPSEPDFNAKRDATNSNEVGITNF